MRRTKRDLDENSHQVFQLTQELTQLKAASRNEIALLTKIFGEVFELKNTGLQKLRDEVSSLRAELTATKARSTTWKEKLKTLESNSETTNAEHERLKRGHEKLQEACKLHRHRLQKAGGELHDLESKLNETEDDLGRKYFRDISETHELRLYGRSPGRQALHNNECGLTLSYPRKIEIFGEYVLYHRQ